MSSTKQLNKFHVDRLVEIEEQMQYLREVPDSIRFLDEWVKELADKTLAVNVIKGRLDGLPIPKIVYRMENLETKTTKNGGFERGDTSTGSAGLIEERVDGLDSSQKAMFQMVTELYEDVKAALDVVRVEVADISTKVNVVVRVVENQTPTRRTTRPNKVKLPEPKPFFGARDAKALENYIFDLEQYFKATDTEIEEEKITEATMHLAEDAKLWWRRSMWTSKRADAQ